VARSDFDDRGLARAAGATPCSFTHHPQSGPHPHLQCLTVPIRTVDIVRPLSALVQGTASTPTPRLSPQSLAHSLNRIYLGATV
jgi:hypothetical protein